MVGLVTTVISAFYYLKVIKIIYFDEEQTKLDQIKNLQTSSIIFISCLLLISYFIYPSVLNNIILSNIYELMNFNLIKLNKVDSTNNYAVKNF